MKITSLTRFQSSPMEREFLRCIDHGFSKFGESRVRLVYSRFETDYNLSRNDIFDHPELFSSTIRNIFRFGSPYIERDIISELRTKFSLPDRLYKGLPDAVSEIKSSRLLSKN